MYRGRRTVSNTGGNANYRLAVYVRILVVSLVLVISALSTFLALPLAQLLNLDPSELQGEGFSPTGKTMTVVVLYASFQFLLIWLVMHLVHRRPLKSLAFTGPILAPLLLGTGVGMIMQASEYLIYWLLGTRMSVALSIPSDAGVTEILGYFLLLTLFLLTLNSLKEELVFRAYPISQFDDYPQYMIPIVILVSLSFAAVHHIVVPFALDDFVSRLAIALLLSFVFYRWRSIWLVSGIHNGLNLLEYLTGGNYKMAGLFKLSMANTPSVVVGAGIDLGIAVSFILLLNMVWSKESKSGKLYLGVGHKRQGGLSR